MMKFKVRLKANNEDASYSEEDEDRPEWMRKEHANTFLKWENLEELSKFTRRIRAALIETFNETQNKSAASNSNVESKLDIKICSLGKTCFHLFSV